MSMQSLSDMYKKYWLYVTSLRHFLGLPFYFDMKFKSSWESAYSDLV